MTHDYDYDYDYDYGYERTRCYASVAINARGKPTSRAADALNTSRHASSTLALALAAFNARLDITAPVARDRRA